MSPKCWPRATCCTRALTALGIRYFPSQANFVLFQIGASGPSRSATDCASAGVLVRDRSYEIAGMRARHGRDAATGGRFLAELESIW